MTHEILYKPEHGDGHLACAEYLEALLKGEQPDPVPFVERVFRSRDAPMHLDPNLSAFPRTDLDHCTHIDAFDFVKLGIKENGRHVARAATP